MNAVLRTDEIAAAAPMVARDICQHFDGRTVLDRINLSLPAGSVLGLIGRNGAGKSTLIRIMLGLIQPTSGTARVFDEAALKLSDSAKGRLAYVPQQPDALAWLTAEQMFDFLARFYPRWDAKFAHATLQRWQIDAGKLLAKLSPGERQRVDIIRALASQPDLLVLDEPAAALDPVARRELLREIATRAGDAGTTVLFSSHIVSDLERVASHVALLHNDRLLLNCLMDTFRENYARLWLPGEHASLAPKHALSRRLGKDGSMSLVIERDTDGRWPGADIPGARIDTLGLEDLFVEIAE